MIYLLTFVVCLFLSIMSTWSVRNLANAKGWIDVPRSDRRMHTIAVPRLGGVAIYHRYKKGSYRSLRLLMHHIVSALRYFHKWGWYRDRERTDINQKATSSSPVEY